MSKDAVDPEARAITDIIAALRTLEDDEARRRVIAYVSDRFRLVAREGAAPVVSAPASKSTAGGRELAGVAVITDSGDVKITARDVKARSGLDAAVRLAHVAIYASERLAGAPLSSRKGLTPILKDYRVYDGNTRARLAREKGIIRSGDSLSLDAHAKQTAEAFIREMLDDNVKGNWKPR